ncbi:MAG TPA: aminotransferase class V-fold PLP-dependent enzyme [Burkholderiaceae bacterium]|nr:aminotransferase class V-fold PLP-dependent enzyme [Burkholderiaceae bacterium]
MHPLLKDAARRASQYLDRLDERSVAPLPGAVSRLKQIECDLAEAPQRPQDVLRRLDELGSPATVASNGGRFFGYVVGGTLPVSMAAHWLATAWDQNAPYPAAAPGAAAFEHTALRWIIDLLGLPSTVAGAFVSGATTGNLCGLAAARHAVLAQAGWDVDAQGLSGAPPITVVIGDEAHPSVTKVLGVLGLGRDRAIRVPVDAQGRMHADQLPRLSGPSIVCLQAGNVNTGACDPFSSLIQKAHQDGAWVHVDGAFGLWAQATRQHRHLCDGVTEADSWATDAHKWLNVPYDSGLVFVRDREALRSTMGVAAPYLAADDDGAAASDLTPELSRRARGIDAWAALASLGRSGLREMIERCCRHAQRFARGLGDAGHEVLNDVVLNQVLVRFGDSDTTRRTIDAIQRDGTCWCGITYWQGRTAMRISVCSWATTDDDVDRSLAAMLRCAQECGAPPKGSAGRALS